jgi:Ca-activated chloride channel family protein
MGTFLPAVELRQPWWLLLILLAVPVFFLPRLRAGRVRYSSLDLLPRGSGWRVRSSFVPDALAALAVVALAVALAGPRVGDKRSRIQKQGIALMMVLDVSGSMRALDLSDGKRERTRLDAVKEVFRSFVLGGDGLAGRASDLVGVVSFARFADTRSPLTLDHDNLEEVLAHVEIPSDGDEDGTALGDGLALAVERLRESPATSKVANLLTDGVQNAGDTAPAQAAALASTLGIKVYTIGAGTTGRAPVRVEDPLTGRSVLRSVPVEIDERLLGEIADKTGGRYFRATDGEALVRIYQAIDRLERTRLEEDRFADYREYYPHATALGLLLAGLGWLAGGTLWRRLP